MGLGALCLLLFGSASMISLVVIAVAGMALHELFSILLPQLRGLALWVTLIVTALPCVGATTGSLHGLIGVFVCSLIGCVLLSFYWFERFKDEQGHVYVYLGGCFFALTYISLLMGHLIVIAHLYDGPNWLVVLLTLTVGSDTGAYYVGKKFGTSKLCPIISPKKTVAGLIGGLVAGCLMATVATALLFNHPVWFRLLPLFVLLIVLGVCGDLAESTLKRSFQIKDSGSILAGHGGILDRLDSLLLSGPILYYFLYFGVVG